MRPFLCLVVIIVAWPVSQSFSQYQPIRFEHCSLRQGLSQGSGYTSTQDKDGYIWMGTQHGLNRFDGYQVSVFYRGSNGYRGSNHINSLLTDSAGNVWIASTGGLSVLDHTSRKFFTAGEFLQQPTILDSIHIVRIWQDAQKNTWALSFANGVYRIGAKKKIAHYQRMDASQRPVDIAQDKNGDIWLATQEGIFRLGPSSQGFVPLALPGPPGKKISGRCW